MHERDPIFRRAFLQKAIPIRIMIIIGTISTIVVLFLAAGAIFLSLQVKKIKQLQYIVSEAIWRRKNKIPLLIETARKAGIKDIPTDEILKLSGDRSYAEEESGHGEDRLFSLLSDIFRKAEQNIPLVSLKKELSADSSNIKIASDNYRFAKAELEKPWFKIFKIFRFAFKIPQI